MIILICNLKKNMLKVVSLKEAKQAFADFCGFLDAKTYAIWMDEEITPGLMISRSGGTITRVKGNQWLFYVKVCPFPHSER